MQSGDQLTKEEKELLESIKDKLNPQLKYYLSKYKDIFPKVRFWL
jgi:hypothetical protein